MININLIAERRSRRVREANVLRWAGMGIVLVVFAVLALNITAQIQYFQERSAYNRVKDELAAKEAGRKELKATEDDIAAIRPKVRLLQVVRVSEKAWMTILADLGRVTPHDVALSSFTAQAASDEVQLHLSGKARDEQTVGEYMLLIRQSTRWAKTPTLGTVSAEGGEGQQKTVRFDMTVPVQGMYGGEL